jgi:hypothetical protein
MMLRRPADGKAAAASMRLVRWQTCQNQMICVQLPERRG